MATINFTENGDQISYQGFCSVEYTTGIHSQLIFLSVLNILMSITAFLGNTLILVALNKETSLHPPSKLLYRNLATTDLCVGIISEPLGVATWMSAVNEKRHICLYADVAFNMAACILCTLILVALNKETSLHPPSKLLYCNLATTDLCVGIIAEPLVVATWMSTMNERRNICRYTVVACNMAGCILCAVSLFTITAISVDRLLALSLGLRYRQVVTLKRTYLTVTSFWVASIVGTTLYFLSIYSNIMFWCGFIAASMCLVTSIFCYAKIFCTLRHHQIQVQDNVHQGQPSQAIPMNIARYRKAVSSALWVQLTLIVCYVPYWIGATYLAQRGFSSSVYLLISLTSTLVFLKSSLNPILYCWKIREVRQAVKDTIRQIGC